MRRSAVCTWTICCLFFFGCAGDVGAPGKALPDSVVLSPSDSSLEPGTSVSFAAQVPPGAAALTWAVQEAGGGTIDLSGRYTAPDVDDGAFHVTASRSDDPSKSASALVRVRRHRIKVTLTPTTAQMGAGASAHFEATVTGTRWWQTTAVNWSVQEGDGGTVDSKGNYTAPASAGTFHVVATSVADPSRSGSAAVTVTGGQAPSPAPAISVSVSPASGSTTPGGTLAFTASVQGGGAGQSTDVAWSVQESGGGTVDGSGRYTAPGSAGIFHVVATSVADSSKSARATVAVSPAATPISVVISPTNAAVGTGQSTTFTATVSGGSPGQSTAVTWSVQEPAGGSIDGAGRYTAPGTPGTFHVVATSVANPSQSARAAISVSQSSNISVSVAPATVAAITGAVVAFTATVGGGAPGQSTAVTWSVQEAGGGNVDGSGRYTAPATPGTFHVVATSVADPSRSGQATVAISQPPSISVAVSPASASTSVNGVLAFSAAVTGTSSGVTWSVQESGGGSIDGSGRYTAPASAGTFHVVATAVADRSKSGQATVNVSASGGSSLVPPDRKTVWNPGLNAVGGIPSGSWAVCATLSPGGSDDAPAIQAALNGCGTNRVVKLNPGTFRLSQAVEIPSNVVLRGSGGPGVSPSSKLVANGSHPLVRFDPGHGGFTQITDLAADAVKDSTSLTLVTPRSLAVGELVMIDQLSDSLTDWGDQDSGPGSDNRGWFNRGPNSQGEAQGRPTGQMMEVASVSGATVTFTTPLHITFKTSNKAQLVRLSSDNSGNGQVIPAIRNAGVEDLFLSGGVGGDTGANVSMSYCAYCWIRNIEADKSNGSSVAMTGTFRSVLRDSYLHETVDPNPGGGGYGLSINWHGADNLVENNIHWNFNKVMVIRASGGGNVIGYNYMDDGWIAYAPCFVETGLNASHSTTPMYELFEGNQSYNFDGDSTHGNSVYITVFRNHLTGVRRAASPLNGFSHNPGGQNLVYEDAQNRRAVGLMTSHRYYTFIGNVLGTPGRAPGGPIAARGPERTLRLWHRGELRALGH